MVQGFDFLRQMTNVFSGCDTWRLTAFRKQGRVIAVRAQVHKSVVFSVIPPDRGSDDIAAEAASKG
jgi:hypothetical protein